MLNELSSTCVIAVVVLVMTVIAVCGTQAERAVDNVVTAKYLREELIVALSRLANVQRAFPATHGRGFPDLFSWY